MGRDNDDDWYPLWVNEHPYTDTDFETPVVLRQHLESARAVDLIAYLKQRDLSEFLLSDDSEELFDPDYASPLEPISVNRVGELSIRLDLRLGRHFTEFGVDEDLTNEARRLLKHALRRNRMSIDELSWMAPNIASMWLSFSTRGRTVADLASAAEEIAALTRAIDGGELNRESVRDLLLAGHVGVLIGQDEGVWLDAKIQLYDISEWSGKVALVHAVSAFANGPKGGLIVFGLGTKKTAGGEVINSFHPVPATPKTVAQTLKVVDEMMFPPPDGLVAKVIEGPNGKYLMVDVPPQPEELKPFLIHGAIVDGRYRGSFISIVTRRDEWSIATRPESIHSTLAAGRALLRSSGAREP
jgi:hypothetical protein